MIENNIKEKTDKGTIRSLKKVFDKFRKVTDVQAELSRKAIELNNGECFTYNICAYCKEKPNFIPKSKTPCVDAMKEMKKQLKIDDVKLKVVENWNRKCNKESLAIINRIRRCISKC